MNQYTVACAIISGARTKAGLDPIWPQEMSQLTGLQHEHFVDIESQIFDIVSRQQKSMNDHKSQEPPLTKIEAYNSNREISELVTT